MKYSIPQEYRVQSREDYMIEFFEFVDSRSGFMDGVRAGKAGIAPSDFGVHSSEYHESYARGYAAGHQDFVEEG